MLNARGVKKDKVYKPKSEFAIEMEKLEREAREIQKHDFMENDYQLPDVKEKVEKFITHKEEILSELYEMDKTNTLHGNSDSDD